MQDSFSQKFSTLFQDIESLKSALQKQVKGQEQTIEPILKILLRGESGLTDPKLPKGSFIALGPTGVGKTETVKVVIDSLFKTSKSLVRLDMSSYKLLTDMKQFMGDSESKGDLQQRVEEAGDHGRILLLDEVEKAHPSFFDLLLQILDEGWLHLHNGDHINFRGWYIWATSNIGSELSTQGRNPSKSMMARALEGALRKTIRPEIVERFNQILTYNRLSQEVQSDIAHLLINKELNRINELLSMDFTIPDMEPVQLYIRREGYTEALGARRMRKTVHENLQTAIFHAVRQGMTQGTLRVKNRNLLVSEK